MKKRFFQPVWKFEEIEKTYDYFFREYLTSIDFDINFDSETVREKRIL